MFFSPNILGRKQALSIVWLAGTAKGTVKLPRRRLLAADIVKSGQAILHPAQPFALRISALLMKGLVVIHHEQSRYLLVDSQAAATNLSKPLGGNSIAVVNLPKGKETLDFHSATVDHPTFIPPDSPYQSFLDNEAVLKLLAAAEDDDDDDEWSPVKLPHLPSAPLRLVDYGPAKSPIQLPDIEVPEKPMMDGYADFGPVDGNILAPEDLLLLPKEDQVLEGAPPPPSTTAAGGSPPPSVVPSHDSADKSSIHWPTAAPRLTLARNKKVVKLLDEATEFRPAEVRKGLENASALVRDPHYAPAAGPAWYAQDHIPAGVTPLLAFVPANHLPAPLRHLLEKATIVSRRQQAGVLSSNGDTAEGALDLDLALEDVPGLDATLDLMGVVPSPEIGRGAMQDLFATQPESGRGQPWTPETGAKIRDLSPDLDNVSLDSSGTGGRLSLGSPAAASPGFVGSGLVTTLSGQVARISTPRESGGSDALQVATIVDAPERHRDYEAPGVDSRAYGLLNLMRPALADGNSVSWEPHLRSEFRVKKASVAAKAFSRLLALKAAGLLKADQQVPFGNIQVSLGSYA